MENIKDVFIITEITDKETNRWIKVGAAFINKDGSLNVVLDSLPLNGRLHIRDRKKSDAK